MAVQEDIRPELEFVIPVFTREGAKVTKFQKQNLDDASVLVQGLGKMGLFVLTASTNPMTSELNPLASLLPKCVEARIPVICVDQYFQARSSDLQAGTVSIVPLKPELSVVLIGEKVGFELFARTSRHLNFGGIQTNLLTENKNLVVNFEDNLPSPLVAPLKSKHERFYDRAVIWADGYDGSAFVDVLSENLKRNLYAEGVTVTSACYWGTDLSMTWMEKAGWSGSQLQGLILIPVSLLESSVFSAENLNAVIKQLNQLQQG